MQVTQVTSFSEETNAKHADATVMGSTFNQYVTRARHHTSVRITPFRHIPDQSKTSHG